MTPSPDRRYAGNPPESRFRWTVETTCGIDAWLNTAYERGIDRLLAADRAGLLEVMAMQTNSTPLLDTAQLIKACGPCGDCAATMGSTSATP